jgi:predicted methyltransferase
VAIDLTAGNGFDTAFLAEIVSPNGLVYAFDIQPEAVEKTRARLQEKELVSHVRLVLSSHIAWEKQLSESDIGRLKAVMMNLGYLPGGDPKLVTSPESTSVAIATAIRLLPTGGVLSVLAYTGHLGGQQEADRVESLLHRAVERGEIDFEKLPSNPRPTTPYLMTAIKKPEFMTR